MQLLDLPHTRLLYLWDFPGKKTGVGCPFFLRGGPSRPRVRTCVSYIGKWILYHWATREAPANWLKKYNFSYHREEFIRQWNRGLVFVFHQLTKSYIPLYRHWVSQLKKDALIESCANIFPSSHHVHFPCRPKLGETF